MRSGGLPAGSSRALRLDPFSLPARFAATDAVAGERVRHVEHHRERVVVRHSPAGMRISLNMPVSALAGVVIRVVAGEGEIGPTITFVLEQKDLSLALPLFVSSKTAEAFTEWRNWANLFGLPLLMAEEVGVLREPFTRMGGVYVGEGRPRRHRRTGRLIAARTRSPLGIEYRLLPRDIGGLRATQFYWAVVTGSAAASTCRRT